MPYVSIILLLLVAACLEAGGDAFVRAGLRAAGPSARVAWIGAGGIALLLYGCFVNLLPWEFGKSLGIYIVLFFVTAQIISAWAFDQPPTTATWVGGALIVAGGVVVSWP